MNWDKTRNLTYFFFDVMFEDVGWNWFDEVGQVVDVDTMVRRGLNVNWVFDDHVDKVVGLLLGVLTVADCCQGLNYVGFYLLFDGQI